jgi:hypothetical protein
MVFIAEAAILIREENDLCCSVYGSDFQERKVNPERVFYRLALPEEIDNHENVADAADCSWCRNLWFLR